MEVDESKGAPDSYRGFLHLEPINGPSSVHWASGATFQAFGDDLFPNTFQLYIDGWRINIDL